MYVANQGWIWKSSPPPPETATALLGRKVLLATTTPATRAALATLSVRHPQWLSLDSAWIGCFDRLPCCVLWLEGPGESEVNYTSDDLQGSIKTPSVAERFIFLKKCIDDWQWLSLLAPTVLECLTAVTLWLPAQCMVGDIISMIAYFLRRREAILHRCPLSRSLSVVMTQIDLCEPWNLSPVTIVQACTVFGATEYISLFGCQNCICNSWVLRSAGKENTALVLNIRLLEAFQPSDCHLCRRIDWVASKRLYEYEMS